MAPGLKIFLNRLWQLALLALAIFVFYQMSRPVKDIRSMVKVYGLSELNKFEVFAELSDLELHGKSIIEINPEEIRRGLTKNPYIEDVKVRRFLLFKPRIKLFVQEAKPWALYENQVIAETGYVIDRGEPRKKDLVGISSYMLLDQNHLKLLKSMVEIIELALDEKVTKVKGDYEDNFEIYIGDLKFKVGLLNSEAIKRVKRIHTVTDKIKDWRKELEYLDLSLNKKEILFGKKK